jgi:arylsulfatase A-like enzyme
VDAQTDLVLEALDARSKDRDKPFCLFVSYLEPHFQNDLDLFVGPRGLAEQYAKDLWIPDDLKALGGSTALHLPGYWGCVRSLDENLGRVLDFLAKSGLDNDTVVLFTSDHGCHFKTRNGEYKRSCHESSIRIPAVLQGPGFDNGSTILNLVTLLDLHATLRDAAGLLPAPDSEGRSIRPLLANPKMDWRDEVFVQVSESQVGRALRTPRWTYGVTAKGLDGRDVPSSPTYTDQYLYDLDHDPAQLQNLIGSAASGPIRDELAARLQARMREAGEASATISR